MTAAGQAAAQAGLAAREAAIASGAKGYYDRGRFVSLGLSIRERQLQASIQGTGGAQPFKGATVAERAAEARRLGFTSTEVKTALGQAPPGARLAEKQQATRDALAAQSESERRTPILSVEQARTLAANQNKQQQRIQGVIQGLNERERGQFVAGQASQTSARTGEIAVSVQERKLSEAFRLGNLPSSQQSQFGGYGRTSPLPSAIQRPLTFGKAQLTKPVFAGTPRGLSAEQELKATLSPISNESPRQRLENALRLQKKIETDLFAPLQPTTKSGTFTIPSLLSKVKSLTEKAKSAKETLTRTTTLGKAFGKGTTNLLAVGGLGQTYPFAGGKASQELLEKPESKLALEIGGIVLTEAVSLAIPQTRLLTAPTQGFLAAKAAIQSSEITEGKENTAIALEAVKRFEKNLSLPKRIATGIFQLSLDPFTNARQQFAQQVEIVAKERGISQEKISGVVASGLRVRENLGVGELASTINIERNIELFGQSSIAGSFARYAQKFGTRKFLPEKEALLQIKKLTRSKFILGGISEGVSQALTSQKFRGEPTNPFELGVAGAIGGISARVLGVPAAQKLIRPVRGTTANILGQVADFPGEISGDILARGTQVLQRDITKGNVFVPALTKKVVKGESLFAISVIKEGAQKVERGFGKIRVPSLPSLLPASFSFNAPSVVPVISKTTTPLVIPTTIPVRARTPIPNNISLLFKTPTTTPIKTVTPIPTPNPLFVPTPTPTPTPTPIPIPIPIKTPTPTPTPTPSPITVPVSFLTGKLPFPPIVPGAFEGTFNFETGGKGLRAQYHPSLFGVIIGSKTKINPLGATFSGFEIRGVPTNANIFGKKAKNKPFDVSGINSFFGNRGVKQKKSSLAGLGFGKGLNKGLSNVGFGTRLSGKSFGRINLGNAVGFGKTQKVKRAKFLYGNGKRLI